MVTKHQLPLMNNKKGEFMARKIIPSTKTIFDTLGTGLKAGLIAGIPSGVIANMTGSAFWGEVVGSVIGSAVGQSTGILTSSQAEIIVIDGFKDAIESLMM